MKVGKNLGCFVAGTLMLGFIGCQKNSQYSYDGKIGEEKVSFREEVVPFFANNNVLTVIKSDGRTIGYVDSRGEDLKLEYVKIIRKDKSIKYSDDEIGKGILEKAQSDFDVYLQKIKEKKISQGYSDIE